MNHDSICIACDSQDTNQIFCTCSNAVVIQCVSCRLGKTKNSQIATLADVMYTDRYFNGSHDMGHNYLSSFMKTYDEYRFNDELKKLERLTPHRNILDVGCATGNFLHVAYKHGWQVFGYDISDHAIQTARTLVPQATVESGELNLATFKNETFSVITLHHVLEHIEDPCTFLRESILPLLKNDGILLLEVPNIVSLEALVLKEQWEDLRPEQHIWHFSPEALSHLIRKAGGTPLSCYTQGVSVWRARLLPDYCWMLASLFFNLSYGGKVGRGGASAITSNYSVDSPGSGNSFSKYIINLLCRTLGNPFMFLINKWKLGKRLVLVARKDLI